MANVQMQKRRWTEKGPHVAETIYFYNTSKSSVANIICSRTCQTQVLLELFLFTTCPELMLLEPMALATSPTITLLEPVVSASFVFCSFRLFSFPFSFCFGHVSDECNAFVWRADIHPVFFLLAPCSLQLSGWLLQLGAH